MSIITIIAVFFFIGQPLKHQMSPAIRVYKIIIKNKFDNEYDDPDRDMVDNVEKGKSWKKMCLGIFLKY